MSIPRPPAWIPGRVAQLAVPASTSNLGPGFDFAGLALDLWLHVRAQLRPGPPSQSAHHLLPGPSCSAAPDWPWDASNLLLRALESARQASGAPRLALQIEVESEIPVARGLGSSGAAVAAGLLLGQVGAPQALPEAELLALGIALEGHPDNVAAALFGGCTLCLPSQVPVLVQQALHPSLSCIVAWTASKLSTRDARSALPKQVDFAAAIDNPRRLALLLEGLRSADPQLLALGSVDHLHVPYRLPLIAGGPQALAAARTAGAWLATISGSGSALFALSSKERAPAVAEALRAALAQHAPEAQARVLAPASGRPRLRWSEAGAPQQGVR